MRFRARGIESRRRCQLTRSPSALLISIRLGFSFRGLCGSHLTRENVGILRLLIVLAKDCSVHYSSAEFLVVYSKYVLSFCLVGNDRGFHCVG